MCVPLTAQPTIFIEMIFEKLGKDICEKTRFRRVVRFRRTEAQVDFCLGRSEKSIRFVPESGHCGVPYQNWVLHLHIRKCNDDTEQWSRTDAIEMGSKAERPITLESQSRMLKSVAMNTFGDGKCSLGWTAADPHSYNNQVKNGVLLSMSLKSCRVQVSPVETILLWANLLRRSQLITFSKSSSIRSTMYGVPNHGSVCVVFPSNSFEDQKILCTQHIEKHFTPKWSIIHGLKMSISIDHIVQNIIKIVPNYISSESVKKHSCVRNYINKIELKQVPTWTTQKSFKNIRPSSGLLILKELKHFHLLD